MIQTNNQAGLCFDDQYEALLILRLNCWKALKSTGRSKKRKKRLRVKKRSLKSVALALDH